MKFKTIAAILGLAVLTGSVLATPDDGIDSFGIYFAPDLETNCGDIPLFTPVRLYFMVANPSMPTIESFEFSWRFDPAPVPAPVLSLMLPPSSVNIGDNYNLIVGIGAVGLPVTPATILATVDVVMLAPFAAHTEIIACNASCDGVDLTYSTYDPAHGHDIGPDGCIAVASVGCMGSPIATEAATFGSVKALYR